MIECVQCLKEFELKPNSQKEVNYRYCSNTCARTHRNKMTKPVKCPKCYKHLRSRWKKHITECNPNACESCKKPTKTKFCSPGCVKEFRKLNPIKFSKEVKEKMSKSKKALYATGWEATAGRCKKYDYESPIAGKIKVDGSWEFVFCQYADKIGLTWRRNKIRFPYIKPKGKASTYQPDFFVEEWNSFVEIKGYETDLDKAKWNQFPKKLIVLRKQEINDFVKILEN